MAFITILTRFYSLKWKGRMSAVCHTKTLQLEIQQKYFSYCIPGVKYRRIQQSIWILIYPLMLYSGGSALPVSRTKIVEKLHVLNHEKHSFRDLHRWSCQEILPFYLKLWTRLAFTRQHAGIHAKGVLGFLMINRYRTENNAPSGGNQG